MYWGPRLVAVLAIVGAAVVLPTTVASADPDCTMVQQPDGSIDYECTEGGDGGEPGDPGGGGTSEPTCSMLPPATFCQGTNSCYYDPHVIPYAPPKGPKPSPDATWEMLYCTTALGGYGTPVATWIDGNEPRPPTLGEQAQTAFGELNPVLGTLGANPKAHSLVTLPTWFWAEGLQGNLTGSSAFGLVAIAEPDHLEVTPGDGSALLQCEWVTTKSDTCSHAYERSSAVSGTTTVDGRRAYAATAEPVWTVSYELNGNPLNVPGAPTELRGPQMTSGVRVAEVQATVTGVS